MNKKIGQGVGLSFIVLLLSLLLSFLFTLYIETLFAFLPFYFGLLFFIIVFVRSHLNQQEAAFENGNLDQKSFAPAEPISKNKILLSIIILIAVVVTVYFIHQLLIEAMRPLS